MTTKDLVKISSGNLTPEQIELVKNTVAKGSTDDELKLFLYTAGRTGLDPLTKQIYFVKRAGQMTIQTGIDGYRAIAERSGSLAGIDDAVFDDETKAHPNKATVTVWRMINGTRVGYTASARWTEYAPQGGQGFMWQKMPYLMLSKCAESLALRKAFPNDLSGLLTTEEMHQAENTKTPPLEMQIVETDENDLDKALGPRTVNHPAPLPNAPPKSISSPVVSVVPQAQTEKIKNLATILDPSISSGAELAKYVLEKTGFDLAKVTYHEMIITRLENMIDKRKENEDAVTLDQVPF